LFEQKFGDLHGPKRAIWESLRDPEFRLGIARMFERMSTVYDGISANRFCEFVSARRPTRSDGQGSGHGNSFSHEVLGALIDGLKLSARKDFDFGEEPLVGNHPAYGDTRKFCTKPKQDSLLLDVVQAWTEIRSPAFSFSERKSAVNRFASVFELAIQANGTFRPISTPQLNKLRSSKKDPMRTAVVEHIRAIGTLPLCSLAGQKLREYGVHPEQETPEHFMNLSLLIASATEAFLEAFVASEAHSLSLGNGPLPDAHYAKQVDHVLKRVETLANDVCERRRPPKESE
jgi:hypothetical protein